MRMTDAANDPLKLPGFEAPSAVGFRELLGHMMLHLAERLDHEINVSVGEAGKNGLFRNFLDFPFLGYFSSDCHCLGQLGLPFGLSYWIDLSYWSGPILSHNKARVKFSPRL